MIEVTFIERPFIKTKKFQKRSIFVEKEKKCMYIVSNQNTSANITKSNF